MIEIQEQVDVVQVRLRCLEAAARPGSFSPAHQAGPVKAILESAQAFAEWVLNSAEAPKGVNALL